MKKQEGSYIGFGRNSRPVFASLFIAARKGRYPSKLLPLGDFFHLFKKIGEGDYGCCIVVQ